MPTTAHLVHSGCPLEDTLHKHSPDIGTAVLQDKVHLGKCKPSPESVSLKDGAAHPAVPSQPPSDLAVLRLCCGALPAPQVLPEPGRITPRRDRHRRLGTGARRHRHSLLETPRVQRGLRCHTVAHPAPSVRVGLRGDNPRGPAPSPACEPITEDSGGVNLRGPGSRADRDYGVRLLMTPLQLTRF